MTLYFNELLNTLRRNEESVQKEHHLFLLGTAVTYQDRPTDSMVRGETFSYAAQLTTLLLNEQKSVDKQVDLALDSSSKFYAHPYHSSSVDVIDGADTPGFEIGDRLAKALMLALTAVAEGKDTISLSGFSRGGVECIVLTHELNRVKQMLTEDLSKAPEQRRTLARIIADSSSVPSRIPLFRHPSYTRAALTSLVNGKHDPSDDEALKVKLLAQLQKLKVKLFVLDPVPGGNVAKGVGIGWQEDSFYTLPDFVVQKFEVVKKHEQSGCFRPIVPRDMPFEVIPGCHGTGDGNQFNHNGKPVPVDFEKRDLSGVQDLVLRRWIDFMFPQTQAECKIDLEHQALDAVASTYLGSEPLERRKQLLANYQHIQENYDAFAWLATQKYDYLSRMPLRLVNFHQHGHTPITELDVYGDGKQFTNVQHVQLWVSDQLSSVNSFEKSLPEQLRWLKINIQRAFQPQDLSQSVREDESQLIVHLMTNKNNHPSLIEAISMLTNAGAKRYMQSHLSPEEQGTCTMCLSEVFKVLVHAKDESPNPEGAKLAALLYNRIRDDLTKTILQHQEFLLGRAHELIKKQMLILTANEENQVETSMETIIAVQKLNEDLNQFRRQIQELEPWCDTEQLNAAWRDGVPHFSPDNEDGPREIQACKEQFFDHITLQQNVLQIGAHAIQTKISEAARESKEEQELLENKLQVQELRQINSVLEQEVNKLLEQHHYAEEQLQAFQIAKQQSRVQIIDAHAIQIKILETEQESKKEHDLLEHKQQIDELKHINSMLEHKLDESAEQRQCAEEQLKALQSNRVQVMDAHARLEAKRESEEEQYLLEHRTQIDELKRIQSGLEHKLDESAEQRQRAEERLKAFLSPEQRNVMNTLKQLSKCSTDYLDHLNQRNDDSQLGQDKKAAVTELLGILENDQLLPTEQLDGFNNKLLEKQDVLKVHRDPMWQRFFRDCLRIVAMTFCGIPYRILTGHAPHFFKPSHGEQFMEDTQELSLRT